MVLKNLPRGANKDDIKNSSPLFNKLKKIEAKKQKHKLKIKENLLSAMESTVYNKVSNFKYSDLQPGMIILGRIFIVTDYYAIVSLPGQISGKLQVTDISETYTNLIKNVVNNKEIINKFVTLSDIYAKGDYVICYVKDFHYDSKKVSLSLNPQLINKNLNPKYLENGSKVILNVSSIEDHGFIMETGLRNLRAFLSVEDIENKNNIYPGKQIICIVKDIKIIENIFTIHVSLKSKYLDTLNNNTLLLTHLIPGLQFVLIIKKICKNGLQVYYAKNQIGYIHQFYLQNILTSYVEGQELIGTLLYITPIVKAAYFSVLSLKQEKNLLKIGDLITEAKVISHDIKGILLQLKKDARGFLPLKRTEVDFERISSVFNTESIHKCKIIGYDLITKLYICTMEKKLLNEKHINYSDLETGSIIEVTIRAINQNNGNIDVFVGKISGIVPSDQITDPGIISNLKIGQSVTARLLQSLPKTVFTLKKSLIESKLPILAKIQDAKVNSVYDGSIAKITNQGILIRFFNNISGWIPKYFLNSQIILQNWNFVIGQTITTVIKDVNIKENKITLTPLNSTKIQSTKYKIGDIIEGVVVDCSTAGVHLRIKSKNKEKDTMAFLPAGHMSPCYEVGKMLASKKVAGDILSAIVFSTNPNIILSSTFAPKITYTINNLNLGDIVLCSIKNIGKQSIKVLLPISKCYKYGVISINEAGNLQYLYENQILFGKILKIDREAQKIELTIHLSKVWKTTEKDEDKMMTSVDILSCYLNKIFELSKNVFYSTKLISKIKIGEQIKGIIESIMDYGFILKLENNIKGIVHNNNYVGNYKQGDEVEGSVIWINYPHEYVEITLLHNIMNIIKINQNKLAKIPIGVQLRGEIILITNWFILVILKGKNTKGVLVSLPVRRHLNDTTPDLSPYQIGNKIRCYGILNKNDADLLLPVCILKSAFEISQPEIKKTINYSLKRKMENIGENEIRKEINEGTNKKILKKDVESIKLSIEKKKLKNSNKKQCNKSKMNENSYILYNTENKEKTPNITQNSNSLFNLCIADCGFKWDHLTKMQTYLKSSSDSENEIENSKKQFKKKKLSASERREFERQKERQIRNREEFLAKCQVPQTIDQFDKLILSSPNNSLIWIQYMAYHLQATEIDKARIVARRALKTINFREENEKLNIWQALLNLESKYGSPESLTKIFQEAIKMNDAYKIYEHMLTIYTDACRHSDVEKIVNIMISKFKQNLETWIICGTAMLKIGMKNKSRQIMQRALQSLPKNKHVDVIVRFAHLENKFGEIERSQTLFEQILSLYPKRTDVWSSYVDTLVKLGEIEIARKILDRAIIQALPARKMKILFKKYIKFEESYGTSENISKIKHMAFKYVEEQCKIIK